MATPIKGKPEWPQGYNRLHAQTPRLDDLRPGPLRPTHRVPIVPTLARSMLWVIVLSISGFFVVSFMPFDQSTAERISPGIGSGFIALIAGVIAWTFLHAALNLSIHRRRSWARLTTITLFSIYSVLMTLTAAVIRQSDDPRMQWWSWCLVIYTAGFVGTIWMMLTTEFREWCQTPNKRSKLE